jgi:protein-S-isoprenylcysteine O-methyltransferase
MRLSAMSRYARQTALANFPPADYSQVVHGKLSKPIPQIKPGPYQISSNVMGKLLRVFPLVFIAVSVCLVLPVAANGAKAKDRHMVLEGLDGDVTTNEYQSFINKLNDQPPPPSNNIGNLMVYEKDGGRIHGMQTFYSFTHDRRVLDLAIVWSDAFLHARNDPTNGRIVWTGKRELCWPNKETNDVRALYSGAENGDVIEHIVNTARLILEEPSLWTQTAPADTYGLGATYLDRAKTYVRECQRSAETTIIPWYVRTTRAGYRLYRPDSPTYVKFYRETGPLPWNQQQCVVGGLLRLAQCHRLLNDGNTNTAFYEKITRDAADWFFSTSLLVSVNGRNCYDWGYTLGEEIDRHQEDCGHSGYDMYILRAYSANLGPSRVQMQRLVNTALLVINRGSNQFSGYVNGTSDESRPVRKYLNWEWIEMSVLDRRLYEVLGNAVKVNREYLENIPVEAAVLYAKHYWATAPAAAATETVVDDAKGVPPLPQIPPMSRKRPPSTAIIGLLWGMSELVLALWKRAKSSAASRDRHSLRAIWLVTLVAIALGIFAAYRVPTWAMPLPKIIFRFGLSLLVLGLLLRWYSIIHLGRFFTVNVAIAKDHQLVESGPYHFIRHPSYTGSLLAALGFSLSIHNWASLLIVFVPIAAVTLWRIHIEEQALSSTFGQAYRDYACRTKRLIPWVY